MGILLCRHNRVIEFRKLLSFKLPSLFQFCSIFSSSTGSIPESLIALPSVGFPPGSVGIASEPGAVQVDVGS